MAKVGEVEEYELRDAARVVTHKATREWRRDQMIAHGLQHDVAADLAYRADVDLHLVCDMLDRGCSTEQLVRIFARDAEPTS